MYRKVLDIEKYLLYKIIYKETKKKRYGLAFDQTETREIYSTTVVEKKRKGKECLLFF